MRVANLQTTNWDDLRLLLAVAREGSFLKAGQQLGVATSTVARRLSAFEGQLGLAVVLRGAGGAVLSDEGKRLRLLAEELERRVLFEQRQWGTGDDSHLSGRVRVTAGDGFTDFVVDAAMAFRERHPGVEIDVEIDARALDVSRREADLALRTFKPQGDLVARRVGEVPFGLYASPGYLAKAGVPRTASELAAHTVVGFSGLLERVPEAKWLAQWAGARTSLRVTTISALTAALERGAGVGVLATMLASPARLVRVLPRLAPEPTPVWLVLHREGRKVKRVSAFADFLAERVATMLKRPL